MICAMKNKKNGITINTFIKTFPKIGIEYINKYKSKSNLVILKSISLLL